MKNLKIYSHERSEKLYRSEGMEPPVKPNGVEIKGHHLEENIVKY